MDTNEAVALLDAELEKYRRIEYADLVPKVGHEEFPEVVGASGTTYQNEIQVFWDGKPNGDIRVLGSIDDGRFLTAFKPVCRDVIVRSVDLA